jgi:hypothetical protein
MMYGETEPTTIINGIKWKYEGPFQESKLAQLDKALYKVVYSIVLWMITEQAKSFYDEMKITDRCTFCGGWL